jgi:Na+-translocating ferredoxin:NAD+ oxidoreductase RnfA subunit
VRPVNGLLNPSRGLLIALIVVFLLLAFLNAFADLGALRVLIFVVLIALLVYFVVLAVREYRRRPGRPPVA